MATTSTQEKATLAIRIRNGQSASGDTKYKYTNLSGIKSTFGTGDNASTDISHAGSILSLISPLLVGTVDGMRFVQTNVIANS